MDEIGNLSLPLQAKILTVLQKREVTRIGSNKNVPIDIRLVCATNMALYDMVKEHSFRQDLLYRINTVEIHLPPLRERQDDIPLLTSHFLKMYSGKYRKSIKKIPASTIKKLRAYHWPGNIRELQHAIERAVIMSDDDVLSPEDFFLTQEETASIEETIDSYNLEEVERQTIQRAIKKYSGNISKAAKELGLTRASLYRRLDKHEL